MYYLHTLCTYIEYIYIHYVYIYIYIYIYISLYAYHRWCTPHGFQVTSPEPRRPRRRPCPPATWQGDPATPSDAQRRPATPSDGSRGIYHLNKYLLEFIYIYIYLVGGLVAMFYFPIYWVANHANWLSVFSEGFKPPTRYISPITGWCLIGTFTKPW